MSFFYVLCTAMFVVFALAALVGHILLIDALLRPFFGRLAPAPMAAMVENALSARPTH